MYTFNLNQKNEKIIYYIEKISYIKIFTLYHARVTDYPNKIQGTENNKIDNFFSNTYISIE